MVGEKCHVEDTMSDVLVMRDKEGPTSKEMYQHEGMHTEYMIKEMLWVYEITGIVAVGDTGQQQYMEVMMRGLYKEDRVPEIREMYETYSGVWDPGLQLLVEHEWWEEQPARVKQATVYRSSFF